MPRLSVLGRLTAIAVPILGALLSSSVPVWGASSTGLTYPFAGVPRITQPFGCTGILNEFSDGSCAHFHAGVDFALAHGTPIFAAAAGQVTRADWDPNGRGGAYNGGYGYSIVIGHAGGIETLYGHLESRLRVAAGERVQAGQRIGYSGSSGNSTGPHLHFGVLHSGVPVDPLPFLSGAPLPASDGSAAPSTGGDCSIGTLSSCLGESIRGLIGGLFSAIGENIAAWIKGALAPFAVVNIWTNTPPELTYAAPAVSEMWQASLWIADGLCGLWLMLLFVQRGRDAVVGRPLEPVGTVLSGVLTAMLGANLSLPLISWYIQVANTVTGAIGLFHGSILEVLWRLVIGGDSPAHIFRALLVVANPITWILLLLLPLAKFVLLLLLGLQMLRRLAMLNLCIIAAPLGLMSGVWEPTRSWSRQWHAYFWPTLVTQLLQVMLLHVGLGMVSFVSRGDSAGIPTSVGDVAAALALFIMQSSLGLAMMVVALKIPHFLNHDLGRVMGMSGTSMGSIARAATRNPALRSALSAAVPASSSPSASASARPRGDLAGDAIPSPSRYRINTPQYAPGTLVAGVVYGAAAHDVIEGEWRDLDAPDGLDVAQGAE